MICGIDEVGRGSLAGPVVSCAVILGTNYKNYENSLNDSKKMTASLREAVSKTIKQHAFAYGIGLSSHEEIDEMNIHKATLLSFKRAFLALGEKIKYVTLVQVDGLFVPDLGIDNLKIEAIVKGDQKIKEIQAASILAKTYRDKMIIELSNIKQYSYYNFKNNKGYSTKEHRQAILKHGPSDIHRMTFNFGTSSFASDSK